MNLSQKMVSNHLIIRLKSQQLDQCLMQRRCWLCDRCDFGREAPKANVGKSDGIDETKARVSGQEGL
jgi:hypothetical protein